MMAADEGATARICPTRVLNSPIAVLNAVFESTAAAFASRAAIHIIHIEFSFLFGC